MQREISDDVSCLVIPKIVEMRMEELLLTGRIPSMLFDKDIAFGVNLLSTRSANILSTNTEQIPCALLGDAQLTYRLNTLVLRFALDSGDIEVDFCLLMHFAVSILWITNSVQKLNPFVKEDPCISSRFSNLSARLAEYDLMPGYDRK
ncbi:hypothetical protein [Anaplasma phagocytophilum]|uniref:hypothetical protein n=1 Tax=Anaplasma phagocytophilum TaxID=948 RepID=UPI00200BDAAB|nr:hypothetical protein [Anaplasma phagocytophilum]UQD54576.1 hypothetical protein ESP60_04665 [Anaplasma phagocytophilum]